MKSDGMCACRVPDEYQPDLEANAVVQVKRKVSLIVGQLLALALLAAGQNDCRKVSSMNGN